MNQEFLCEITEIRALNPANVSLTIRSLELAAQAQPGQFLHVKCGEGTLLRRPISICDRDNDCLRMVFEVKGEGTTWLAKRRAGEVLSVLGPLGHGYSFPEGRVLVAGGGIGVPPMLYAARRAGADTVACLGFRTGERAILLEEFADSCSEVHVATDDGSLGEKAFVAQLVEHALQNAGDIAAVFACGPRIMLKTVYDVCRRYQVPCQVSMEERMGCGIGACLVCACKDSGGHYRHVCKDGPVFPAEEVDWNA